MEYDEVLDKLVDKVLVLDLKRRKNEILTQIPGTKKQKKHNELLPNMISVRGIYTNTNTNTILHKDKGCPT